MAVLTEENELLLREQASYLDELIEAGILTLMDPELFPAKERGLLILCGDGDQFDDLSSSHLSMCNPNGCHHRLCINGTPLRIAPNSPVADWPFDSDLLLKEAADAMAMKKLPHATLYPHFPCGKATLKGVSIQEQLKISRASKDALIVRFKEAGIVADVIYGFHIEHIFAPVPFKALYKVHWHAFANRMQIDSAPPHVRERFDSMST